MKPERFIFPAFLLITLVTYWPSIGSGFVFDFVGWQRVYDPGTFGDILHCFGYPGNQQVYHLFFYTVYALFHLNSLAWFIVFCTLHAFNAWLAFTWLKQVNLDWRLNIPMVYILLTCLIFLIHPYCVEPVAYKACIHYLLSMSWILGVLILVPRYLTGGSAMTFGLLLFIYAISLFTLEISYVTPLVIGIYVWLNGRLNSSSVYPTLRSRRVVLSFWLLLLLALILNKLTLGAWVGHYGSSVHLSVHPLAILSTEIKYLVKHIAEARMYGFAAKTLLFDKILSNPMVVASLTGVGLVILLVYLTRQRQWNVRMHLAFFGLIASLLYVLPVANLFFYFLDLGANDRFSYVPLLFLWISVLALISRVPKKWILPVASILLMMELYGQQKIIRYWQTSTQVLNHLKQDYRWRDRPYVFVLNSPDNYHGVWMTTMIKIDSGIDELIDCQTDEENKGMMYDIYQFNMESPNDGVKVEQTGPMQLRVTFNQWGNWWHLHGIGATPYENDYYKAEVLDYPYQVTFKKFPPGSAIIYQDSMTWKEFKLRTEE